mmetsp:Transcript_24191/g.59226  ORF Transcript_24191/g.59226 Transcript_24191/m.59226 type:complete len:1073 (+) Transcript_24191:176-3394(+)
MTTSLLAFTSLLLIQTANAVDIVPKPQYMGCFADSDERAMNANGYSSDPKMTIQMCVDMCAHEGYAFAGLEVGSECFCDDDYTRWGEWDQSRCRSGCKGDTAEECGGPWALSVYATDSDVEQNPLTLPPLATPTDCVKDDTNNRAMTRLELVRSPVIVERCIDECLKRGHDFAGLQNGSECHCGDSSYDKNGREGATCNKDCVGECGGVGSLTVYDTAQSDYQFPSAAPSTYHATWAEERKLACVLDTWDRAMPVGPVNKRTVNPGVQSPPGMTVQACITYCEGLNYAYAGLENRNECFCGNEYRTHGFAPVTDCKHKCNGDQSQECGGPWRVTVYATGSGPFTPLPGQPSIPNLGCWADNTNDRAMTTHVGTSELRGPVYVQRCINHCFTQGHNFAGLQSGRECYCTDTEAEYQKHGNSTSCDRECGGIAYGNCGGNEALTVYSVDEHNVDTRFARPATGNCVATAWGDPHIITFDGLKYDVHVMSEMIFLKSRSTEFVVQARLESVYTLTSWKSKPAVTTGIVIKGATANLPTVQVSLLPQQFTGAKPAKASTVRQVCDVELFVDGTAFGFNENLGTTEAHVLLSGSMIHVSYPSQNLQLDMKVVVWQNVCHFSIDYVLLDCANNNNNNDYIGLLGSPDGDKTNDWMDENKVTQNIPNGGGGFLFQPAYDYAINNWCIGNPSESHFTYPYSDWTFFDYTNCLEPFDPDFEQALVAAEHDPNNAKCNGDLGCILDTVALGDEAGDAYLNNPAVLETITAEIIHSPPAPTPPPVAPPTPYPTTSAAPSIRFTSVPSTSPTQSFGDDSRTESNPAGSNGDPHFRTWKGEHFEFHGQCDVVMAKVKNFANQIGIDLDIHLRTKMVRFWSYIEAVAIRIGNDILEVKGSAAAQEDGDEKLHYWSNYEHRGDLTDLAGFPVTISPRRNKYTIDLESAYPGQKIEISTFKEFVSVKVVGATEDSFGKSVGMTGDFDTGKTLARDGVTELNCFNELGQEWQVLPSDGKLFHKMSRPQFPEHCFLPEDPRGERARRLAESNITEEAAEAACAQLKDELDRKDCVYDILATQDMDMVGAY